MIIISPSKRQAEPVYKKGLQGIPYPQKTKQLIQEMALLSVSELEKVLGVSQKIAESAHDYYQFLLQMPEESVAAIDLYRGDVFQSLDVDQLSDTERAYLQENLQIISPLYGLIEPECGIWPYRLEMVSKVPNFPILRDYWSCLQEKVERLAPGYIFNLASVEYAACIQAPKDCQWVDVIFQDRDKNGKYKVIAVKAKRMRGRLLRYMAKHNIQKPEALFAFSENDYNFDEMESSPNKLFFRAR